MKKTEKKIVFSFFLLIMFVLCLSYFNIIKNHQQQIIEYVNKIERLESRILLQTNYSGHVKIPEKYRIQSITGELKLAKDFFTIQTLVLYISSNQCNSCINDAINKVETYLQKQPEFKYVIISKGFGLRELKLMQTDRNINAKIYSLVTNDFSFFNKMDEVSFPFYFVVDENVEVSNIFFPMKSSSILEDRYFENVNKN